MGHTLPTLTVEEMTLQSPGDPTDIAVILQSIATLIGTSTDWEVRTNNAEYLVFGPKAARTLAAMTFIIAGAAAKTPNAAQLGPNTTATANRLYLGAAPDASASDVSAAWDGAGNPFGAARFSGYWPISHTIATANVATVRGFAADGEIMSIYLLTSATIIRGLHFGAIIEQPDDLDAEAATDRIYGMYTTGTSTIANGWRNSSTGFLTHWSSNDVHHMGVFNPAVPATWIKVSRPDCAVNSMATGLFTTVGGRQLGQKIVIYDVASSLWMGWLRNMRYVKDCAFGDVVNDHAGAPIGFAIGPKTSGVEDTVAFIGGEA